MVCPHVCAQHNVAHDSVTTIAPAASANNMSDSNNNCSKLLDNANKLVQYWIGKYAFAASEQGGSEDGIMKRQRSFTLRLPSTFSTEPGSSGTSNYGRGDNCERATVLHSTVLVLQGAILGDIDILALYYATPLLHIAQQLMGVGDVVPPPTAATIVCTYPTPLGEQQREMMQGIGGDQWMIDGFTGEEGSHSPYNLLLGIALTDITEPFQVRLNFAFFVFSI